jgi:hypothetical protein
VGRAVRCAISARSSSTGSRSPATVPATPAAASTTWARSTCARVRSAATASRTRPAQAAARSAANGGNLYKGSAVANLHLAGTIVSDGVVAGGATPVIGDLHGAFAGGLASGGYNLVRARGDATGFIATDFANGTNPQLAALGANGGPTATHALASTSPLFDAWTATCGQAIDQRARLPRSSPTRLSARRPSRRVARRGSAFRHCAPA